VNSKSTTLAGALTSSGGNNGADIEVTDTTGFPSSGFITIDQEAISYTSILSGPPRFSGIVRGADGTTATAHSAGSTVKHNVIAAHHNAPKDEIIAVEQDLVNGVRQNVWDNILPNGEMEIWNRGTSTVVSGTGSSALADGWTYIADGGTPPTVTLARESTTKDSGDFSLRLNITSAGSGSSNAYIRQDIQDVNQYVGKAMTLSVRIRCNTASLVRASIRDSSGSTFSSFHTGDSTFQTLTVTRTISASTSVIAIEIGVLGTTMAVADVYIDRGVLVLGSVTPSHVPFNTKADILRLFPTFQILQVLDTKVNSSTTTTSTSFVDTGLSLAITPKTRNSKILVLIWGVLSATDATALNEGITAVFRDSTDLTSGTDRSLKTLVQVGGQNIQVPCAYTVLDTPDTLSSVTYKLRIRSGAGTTTTGWGQSGGTGLRSEMILVEVLLSGAN
jgi:hypothetical protein